MSPLARTALFVAPSVFTFALLALAMAIASYEARTGDEIYRYQWALHAALGAAVLAAWSCWRGTPRIRLYAAVIAALSVPLFPGLGGPGDLSLTALWLGGHRLPRLLGTADDCRASALKAGATRFRTSIDSGGDLTDVGAARLARREELELIHLEGFNGLTEHGFHHLANLPRLSTLELAYGSLEPAAARALVRSGAIKRISLAHVEVDEDSLAEFVRMTHLRALELRATCTTCSAVVDSIRTHGVEVIQQP